jgi:plastocyanin
MRPTLLAQAAAISLLLGLAAACDAQSSASAQAKSAEAAGGLGTEAKPRLVVVTANDEGFVPSKIPAVAGETLTLRFTRTVDQECVAQVMFPEQNIKKDLPLNQPVDITIHAEKAGTIPFMCGMKMVKGSIDVKAK